MVDPTGNFGISVSLGDVSISGVLIVTAGAIGALILGKLAASLIAG